MQRFRMYLLACMGFLCLVGVLISADPPRVHSQNPPPTFNARITNTPLPVTGSLNVAVNGTVQSQESGNWSVAISGTPSVIVADGKLSGVEGKLDTGNSNSSGTNNRLDGLGNQLTGIGAQLGHFSFDGGTGGVVTHPDGVQNVNIVGGNPNAPVASNVWRQPFTLGLAASNHFDVNPPVNASGIFIGALGVTGSTSFQLTLTAEVPIQGGTKSVEVGFFDVTDGQVITLPERLRITKISVASFTPVNAAAVTIIGD